jgi:hypothetical protein
MLENRVDLGLKNWCSRQQAENTCARTLRNPRMVRGAGLAYASAFADSIAAGSAATGASEGAAVVALRLGRFAITPASKGGVPRVGRIRDRAHSSTGAGRKTGKLPQKPSIGRPPPPALGIPIFCKLDFEIGNFFDVKNFANGP